MTPEVRDLAELIITTPAALLEEATGYSRTSINRLKRSSQAEMKKAGLVPPSQNLTKSVPKPDQNLTKTGLVGDGPPLLVNTPLFSKENIPPRGTHTPVGKNSKPKPSKRSCPVDWQPRPEDRQLASSLGVNPDELRDTMVDWSNADPTRNRKANWDATYRNWARRDGDRIKAERVRQEAMDRRYQERSQPPLTEADRLAMKRQKEEVEFQRESVEWFKQMTGEA